MQRLIATAAAGVLLVGTGVALTRPAAATTTADAPIIAMIDTGVRPTHQEFDYRGPTSTDDQFVAWWDFTSEKKGAKVNPAPGQLWDTAVPDPYDTNGHGTGTTAMAAGLNVDPTKTPSAAPGAKLAIARVVNGAGTLDGDIPAAIHWAVDTVHADVINISIGSVVPEPPAVVSGDYRAIAYARSKGVLVTVGNGNSWANQGYVGGQPGWTSYFASSPDVLAVGAYNAYGLFPSTDPEVGAEYFVTVPTNASDSSYELNYGTSFASPYVAGFAAKLIEAARSTGAALPVDRLETLIKYSALDQELIPPTFEGYGQIGQDQLPAAEAHAAAGTLPPTPSAVNVYYVDTYEASIRQALTSVLIPEDLCPTC